MGSCPLTTVDPSWLADSVRNLLQVLPSVKMMPTRHAAPPGWLADGFKCSEAQADPPARLARPSSKDPFGADDPALCCRLQSLTPGHTHRPPAGSWMASREAESRPRLSFYLSSQQAVLRLGIVGSVVPNWFKQHESLPYLNYTFHNA